MVVEGVSVLPNAAPADWRVLRQEGGCILYHAATPMLELHAADAEAYLHGLAARVPSLFALMRETGLADRPFEVALVTASPYEAQDYTDSAEDIVEKIAMPPALRGWVGDFAAAHRSDERFRKRRRDSVDVDRTQDGIGDPRISQLRDVYRSPRQLHKERIQ